MKNKKNFINFYKIISLHTLNALLLILLINLILAGFFWMIDAHFKTTPKVDPRVMSHREKYSDADAYTHMVPDEVAGLLDEQDAMSMIGFQHEPWVQFRNPMFHGIYMNTNVRGFRKTKNPESLKGVPITIYVFGGSTTFGYGVSDDYTIPSFIQTILQYQYPDSPILVKNFGQGFYYSTQELLLLISLLKENDIPDIALFIDGANDTHQLQFLQDQPYFTDIIKNLWNTRGKVSILNGGKDYSWIPMVRLAKIISRKLGLKNPLGKNRDFDDQTGAKNHFNDALMEANRPAYVVNRYNSNLRIIRSLCREYGIKCYFVWQPVPFFKYDRSLHRTFPYEGPIPKYWSAIYKILKHYSSPDFLYLGEFLADVQENVFVDDVHYNEKYNEKIAAAICEFLKPGLEDIIFRQNP